MKKALIIIFIVAVASGIYFYLQYYYERDKVDLWDLVPKNALAVYETEQPIKIWNDLLELPFWKNLSSIPEIDDIRTDLEQLDSITGSAGNLERMFRDRKILISFHKISNTELDFTLYLTLNTQEKRKIMNTIIDYFKNLEHINYDVRTYEDFSIHELSEENGDNDFTFIEYKNHFIGSFTPFLIDDVVRNISNNFQSSFRALTSEIFNTRPIEMDEGNLYINVAKIPELIRNFSQEERWKDYDDYLKWFTGAAYYDIAFENNRIFFSGATKIPENNNEYFLSTFYDQSPQDIEAIYYLPNRTATYASYTYEDFTEWRKAVDIFWEKNFPQALQRKIRLLEEYNIYERDFYAWIGNEIGLATLQSIDLDHPDKLLIIRSKDYNESTQALDDLIMVANDLSGDTLLFEDFAGKRIKRIPIKELPMAFLGEEFSGFEDSYYTDLGPYVVVGNSFEVIKHLLNEFEEENTWGKSLKFMQYFDNVQKRANVNYFINFGNAWNAFFGSLNDEWKDFFKKFDRQFKHFEILSFQFSNINNNFYTSAAIQHRPETSVISTPSEFFREQLVVTDYPIVSKPYIFRSHLDRNLEVMLQDDHGQLYFISNNGKLLWKKRVGAQIKSGIFQVDYYKNGKLQYLFASDSAIYIYDRLGNVLDGFPVKLEHPIDLDHMNLIDYANSREYRFLFCDTSGDIYLTDKNGGELEGWIPNSTGGENIVPPFHVRIGARDCMVSILQDGTVNLFNRRSELYNGFPVKLNTELSASLFMQKGADFDRSLIHLVNEQGEVIKIDLNGNMDEKLQLFRPDQESRFQIVPDALNNTYVINRQDFNSVSILNQQGEPIFDTELLYTEDLQVQFYNFSAGNEVYVFVDAQQGFAYLYDSNGVLINQQPIESGFKVGLLYSESTNKYKLYSCYRNQFSVLSFYKK